MEHRYQILCSATLNADFSLAKVHVNYVLQMFASYMYVGLIACEKGKCLASLCDIQISS